jgi:predicted hydrocarbon binding protein
MSHPDRGLSPEFVAVPRATLAALRQALVRAAGDDAAARLQEAGYAGGEAVFEAFERWLAARSEGRPDELPVGRFEQLASDFFRERGWGTLTVGTLRDAVVTLDSVDWWEDEQAGRGAHGACDLTVGLLASFFGRVADQPLSVLQVEYRAAGDARSRFLLGSTEVLDHVYERLAEGDEIEAAVAGVE